jgi:hypothetical protein
MARLLIASMLLASASFASAEEYDVIVTLKGDVPLLVPFFRCTRNGDVIPTEDMPASCKEREIANERTFSALVARVTNIGPSIVWVHIGQARIPVLPGKVYRRLARNGNGFHRVFLSGEPGAIAHVFASNPVLDEPEPDPPKPARER